MKRNGVGKRIKGLVAPHAGAWIETVKDRKPHRRHTVAPHAGAWIETVDKSLLLRVAMGRPPCGGVD